MISGGFLFAIKPCVSSDANLAKETKEYTLGGPYELRQGGMGALLLNPVYQSDEGEDGTFLGFVITVIDWDRFISELKLEKLSEASLRQRAVKKWVQSLR